MSDSSPQYQPLGSSPSGGNLGGNQGNPPPTSSLAGNSQITSNPSSSSPPSSNIGQGGTSTGSGGAGTGGIGGISGSSLTPGGSSSNSEYDQIISYSKVAESKKNTDGTPTIIQNSLENRTNTSWITRCDNINIKLRDAERVYSGVKEHIDLKGAFKLTQAKKHLESLYNFKSFLPIVCVTVIWFLLGVVGLLTQNTSSPPIDSEQSSSNFSDTLTGVQSIPAELKNSDSQSEISPPNSTQASLDSDLLNSTQAQAILVIWLAMLIIGIGFCSYLWISKTKALSYFKLPNTESGTSNYSDVIAYAGAIKEKWSIYLEFKKSIHQELPIEALNFSGMRENISNAKNIFLKRERDYDFHLENEKKKQKAQVEELEGIVKNQLEPPPSFMVRKVVPSTRSHPYGEDVYKIEYGGMQFEISSKGVIFDYKEMSTIIGSDNPDVLKFRTKVKTQFKGKFSPTCNPYLKNFEHLIGQLEKRDKELEENYAKIELAVPRLSPDKNGHESAEQALREITQLFQNHQIIRNRKLDFIEGPETNTSSMGSVFAGGNLSPTAMPGNPNPVQ